MNDKLPNQSETSDAAIDTNSATIERRDAEYVMTLNGKRVGELVVLEQGDTIELPHTMIDPKLRGSGLGAKLVQTALDDITKSGNQRVIPTCPFVARYIQKHPEYRPLLHRGE